MLGAEQPGTTFAPGPEAEAHSHFYSNIVAKSSQSKDKEEKKDEQQEEENKMSALDLIKANFDFVQNQYREDFEK